MNFENPHDYDPKMSETGVAKESVKVTFPVTFEGCPVQSTTTFNGFNIAAEGPFVGKKYTLKLLLL